MELAKAIKQVKPFRNDYHKASVNLIFSGKWIIHLHNELLRTYDLTLQQYNILRILRGQHPQAATVKLIQERMLDKMSDASRIVENLRKKELLARYLNPRDRRRVDVIITQRGLALLTAIDENESTTMDNFLSNLSLGEVDQLNMLLDRVRKN